MQRARPHGEHGSCSNSRCHAETSRSSASLPNSIHCFVDTRARDVRPPRPPLQLATGEKRTSKPARIITV
ncbi:hypothetical protein BDA96_09G064700 [Sorghum bicolor]|uniref:Uncharacterized protein n=2 Tax=Sorghum bicolor TaxID=4558 RepID=A0A921U424_SORBI|nr:hypothetical protein BDA96_09G064700 [Sorghum bicolor]KXG21432.1 hypothetical protein SORBI_3009G061300 [Sorghum bicolor]